MNIIPKDVSKKIDDAYRMLTDVNRADHQIWFESVLFSWQWWIGVALFLLPWIIWWICRVKESTSRLMLGGFFVISVSMLLDSFGAELGLWDYRYETIPFMPSFAPWDLSLVPVFFLLLVQSWRSIPAYVKGIIYASVAAFLGEPLFEWLGYYRAEHWSPFYSWPIYWLIYWAGHKLVDSGAFQPLKNG